jgi:hypothetical protein
MITIKLKTGGEPIPDMSCILNIPQIMDNIQHNCWVMNQLNCKPTESTPCQT